MDSSNDPLIDEAIKTVCRYDRASASLLQRKLSIDYARAARLLDALTEMKILAPGDGAKPRDVLVRNSEEYFKTYSQAVASESTITTFQPDPLLEEAIRIVCQYDQVATSLLQRKLNIGFTRAETLMDQLSMLKIILFSKGSVPVEVNIKDANEALNVLKRSLETQHNDSLSPSAIEAPTELIKINAAILEKTLESFGITCRVAEVNKDPGEVEFCLEIALGTNVDDITKHNKDIALATASKSGDVKIEAPIPGRSLVGITIPNPTQKEIDAMLERWKEKTSKQLPKNSLSYKEVLGAVFILTSHWLEKIGHRIANDGLA